MSAGWVRTNCWLRDFLFFSVKCVIAYYIFSCFGLKVFCTQSIPRCDVLSCCDCRMAMVEAVDSSLPRLSQRAKHHQEKLGRYGRCAEFFCRRFHGPWLRCRCASRMGNRSCEDVAQNCIQPSIVCGTCKASLYDWKKWNEIQLPAGHFSTCKFNTWKASIWHILVNRGQSCTMRSTSQNKLTSANSCWTRSLKHRAYKKLCANKSLQPGKGTVAKTALLTLTEHNLNQSLSAEVLDTTLLGNAEINHIMAAAMNVKGPVWLGISIAQKGCRYVRHRFATLNKTTAFEILCGLNHGKQFFSWWNC